MLTDSRVVIHYLNEHVGRQYREVDSNLKPIMCRLKEPGVTLDGVKQMIDRMVKKWGTDPKMTEYLRPQTLFGKEKFDGYYAARAEPVTTTANGQPSLPFNRTLSPSEQRNADMGLTEADIAYRSQLARRKAMKDTAAAAKMTVEEMYGPQPELRNPRA